MLDIEVRVLIGWYSLASQSERVPTRCFYVKVANLSYGEYIICSTVCALFTVCNILYSVYCIMYTLYRKLIQVEKMRQNAREGESKEERKKER